MQPQARMRQANPHLGVYYGILTSAFISLGLCLAMFEQLGWRQSSLAFAMLLGPVAGYLAIAAAARTFDVADFFVSGRRVPPVYNGAVLAAVAVGGIGFFAYSGALFFLGFDGLAIGLGWTAGLILSGLLFVPYLRKAGTYTVPGFLGQRFRSRILRAVASLMQLPPTALLLAAEIKVAALILALFLPLSYSLAVAGVALAITTITFIGGMRSLTWSGSAQFIVGVVGFAVPLIVVSVLLTNLPAPQLTYGEILTPLQRSEVTAGLAPAPPEQQPDAVLPAEAPRASTKPFAQAFGAMSATDFVVLFFCLTVGIAALPSLLARSGVTASLADQRRSVAWGALFVALFAASAPALAAFVKFMLFQDLAQNHSGTMPAWLGQLGGYRFFAFRDANGNGSVDASEIALARDGIALALPIAARLPFVCTVLMATAGLGLALAAAASHLFTLASSLADDVIRAADPRNAMLPRVMMVWVTLAATALSASVFLAFANIDAIQALVAAPALAGAVLFPALVLAIWWKGCTIWGAIAAMLLGFLTFTIVLIFGGSLPFGHDHLTTAFAALIGAPIGLMSGVAASLIGPKPSAAEIAYFDEVRDSRGDALYDRARKRVTAAATAAAASAPTPAPGQ